MSILLPTGVKPMTSELPLLRIENVSKSFGDKPVLKGVAFSVEKGSATVLMGASGSGKSTLLRCINLLETMDSGCIVFDGCDIQEIEPSRLRASIGMVFQNFELFPHLSAAQNIMLGPMQVLGMSKSDALERAVALLNKVHLPDKKDAYPDELSGGQQQRVAIARSLAMNPRIVLYDEPTSALDPMMVKEVLDVIVELNKEGMTSLIVSHEIGFAKRIADHVVYMEDGAVLSKTPAATFFSALAPDYARRFLSQMA